jgi:hypothetical protein
LVYENESRVSPKATTVKSAPAQSDSSKEDNNTQKCSIVLDDIPLDVSHLKEGQYNQFNNETRGYWVHRKTHDTLVIVRMSKYDWYGKPIRFGIPQDSCVTCVILGKVDDFENK